MFIKDRVVKVINNAHTHLSVCLDEIQKIEEMFGDVPQDGKLTKMKQDALEKTTNMMTIVMGIVSPLAEEIIKFAPECFEVFQYSELIVFRRNIKFTKKVDKQ